MRPRAMKLGCVFITMAALTSTLRVSRIYVAAFSVASRPSTKGTMQPTSNTIFTTRNRLTHTTNSFNNARSNPTRLFFSQRNDNNKEDKSIFQKATDSIKNLVPSFLRPKSSQITQRQKAKDQVSSSIDTMLKDAPLGIRMMGKMMAPIVSSVAGSLAEAMEEQSRQISDILDDAKMYIVSDKVAIQELGEPIEVGMPFSQSSSTTSINGQTRSSINASFEVRGSRGSGVASIEASNGNIDQLVFNVNGRRVYVDVRGKPSRTVVDVGTSSSSKRGSGLGKNRVIKDDDIIDAEFVEKKKY